MAGLNSGIFPEFQLIDLRLVFYAIYKLDHWVVQVTIKNMNSHKNANFSV